MSAIKKINIKDTIINDILIPSIHRLYELDLLNIEIGVSERNICARLAHHIENIMREHHNKSLFQDYYADVEYNRMGNKGDMKYYEDCTHFRKYMVSDLLIHKRGKNPNYLAIEMKRKGNKRNAEKDKERLKALVSPMHDNCVPDCVYDTLVGAFITYSPKDVRIELFENVGGISQLTDTIVLFVSDSGSKSLVRINV